MMSLLDCDFIKKRRFKFSIMMLTVAGGLVMVSPALAEAATVQPIKIGVLLPLSGRYASAGQDDQRGIDLVVDLVNKNGGIKSLGGAKIDLVVADDASTQVTTAQELRRLVQQSGVKFVIGPYSTPEAEAAAPVAERSKVGFISTQASFDGLFERGYKYVSTVSMTSSQFGDNYVKFVDWLNKEHNAKIKTIVITYPNNDYGETAKKAAEAGLKAQGIKLLGEFGFSPTTDDMTPIVQRVRALGPDCVISIGYLQDGILLHRARVAQNYTSPPIWVGGSDSFTNDRLWQLLGPKIAEKALGGRTFGLAQFDEGANTPGVHWLVKTAEQAGYKPDQINQGMAAGAQAAWIMDEALEKAGSDNPERIAAAIREVHLPADSPRTTLPQFLKGVSFDKTGKPIDPRGLFVHWADGKKTVIFPTSIADGKFNW